MAGTNQTYIVYEEVWCNWTDTKEDKVVAVCANEQLVHTFIDEYNKDGNKAVWYEPQTVIQFKGDAGWHETIG